MGSIASTLDERAAAELGQELWQKHKEIVAGFWGSISRFFDSLDVNGFKVYQDGLIAGGKEGLEIVKQGVKMESRNYELISRLLQGGAILVKTEDSSLVKEEYSLITKIAHAKSLRQRETAALRYRLARGRLLAQRDSFIATRIHQTLAEGETGILFIGAYHNVLSMLAADIKVTQVKEMAKVKEYHNTLLSKKRHGEYLQQLTEYLVSSVSITSS
jgi:hypothetical protein